VIYPRVPLEVVLLRATCATFNHLRAVNDGRKFDLSSRLLPFGGERSALQNSHVVLKLRAFNDRIAIKTTTFGKSASSYNSTHNPQIIAVLRSTLRYTSPCALASERRIYWTVG